ncbi:protein kintoun [Betta splendens]|uniref:Protein kintoun n=1 Tax=Betta splendens TaxID=158456 RepID=A0A6P7LJB5_BETSP|nr:protein kintoun [Betta splendens]
MEVGDKLSELNLTGEEMDKLTKALKDDRFKEMLREYAQEISDPESRKKYEEEIQLLERERGNSLEFIHPQPFRALKTSVDGRQKCFINICGNDKIGKPECKCGVSEDGRRGQNWSLPHSLHPGRQDTDPKGNKITIYDVVFHPDTLHIATTSEKFMEMVVKTAVQGIQNSFNVSLDENNVREMKTKYKGTPQPCVIRRPIPGHKAKQPSEDADPLSFPYPHEKSPVPSSHTKPATDNSPGSQSFHIQLQRTKEPTKPNYAVKYRSVIDLQDYRCSRDSTKSPRPKAIVVTVDLPLVKSVADASLEVKERSLLLETKAPAYRLELPLAYPVDEDTGEAKFNKHTGQLIVTLPVLPPKANDLALAPVSGDRSENESGEERQGNTGAEEDDKEEWKKGDDKKRGQEIGNGQIRSSQEVIEAKGHIVGEDEGSIKQECVEEERGAEKPKRDKTYESGQEQEDGEQVRECNLPKIQDEEDNETSSENKVWGECDGAAECEEQDMSDIMPNVQSSDLQRQTDAEEAVHSALKDEVEAACHIHASSEESQTAAAVSFTMPASSSDHTVKDCSVSQETEEFSTTPGTDGENTEGSGNRPEDVTAGSGKQQEGEAVDEDDLPAEHQDKLPDAVLRETDEHGNETIISDHSTCAGFTFQNTLIYELD